MNLNYIQIGNGKYKLRLAKNQMTACTIPNLKNQTHTFVFLLNAWENSVHKLEKIFNISL